MKTIGENIRNLRLNRRLTQEELAKAAKINQGQLSEYENGKSIPSIEKLAQIADAFGVSVAVLDERLLNVHQRGNGNVAAVNGSSVIVGQTSPAADTGAEIEAFRAGLIMEIITLDIEPAAKDVVLKVIATYKKELPK